MKCLTCGHDNRAGAESCSVCGKALTEQSALTHPAPDPQWPTGERKHVTALFCDLAGYTAMTEKIDPEEVRELMGRVFGEVAEIISRYGGTVEKYIGDAVMALFGVPSAHEDDPLRAVHAAREIQRAVESISPEIETRINHPLSTHCGINTGLVVTGEDGIKAGTMGVVGDTVNVASRLCGLAQAGEILIGRETAALLGRFFVIEQMRPVRVKGKGEDVNVFRVLEPRTLPAATRHFAGLRARLVGREREFALLGACATRVCEGSRSILAVRGEAGTGKTRLVDEFRQSVQTSHQWLAGSAYDHTRGFPYFPIMNMLGQAWGIEERDSARRVREKLESYCHTVLEDADRYIPYLGALFSLDYPEIAAFSPEYRKDRTHEALLQLFQALAKRKPTVFFVEDVHWADPSSVDLLREIALRFKVPALVLATYRPPFTLFPAEHAPPDYREVELETLPEERVGDLISALLEGASVPRELEAYVREKSEGNPLYVEEVLTSLIETQVLRREDGKWNLSGPLESFDVPDSLRGVIASRLDRLAPPNKKLLQEASVVGRSFFYAILRRITTVSNGLRDRLEGLVAQDMIRVQALEPDLEYVFKHPLVQEVIYDSLLRRERQAIHERVGQAIEEVLQDRLPEYFERLAHHYSNGNSRAKAVDYLIKSGEKAMNRFALHESHGYYGKAYALLNTGSDMGDKEVDLLFNLLQKWATVYFYFGNFGELLSLLRRHEVLAERLQDKSHRGMFYQSMGTCLMYRQHIQDSYRYLKQALALGEESANLRVVGYACTWLAATCGGLTLFEEALAYAKRAQQIAATIPEDHYLNYQSLAGEAAIYNYIGDAARNRAMGAAMLEYGARHAFARSVVEGNINMAFGHGQAGDYERALASSEQAVRGTNDPHETLYAQCIYGQFLVFAGRPAPVLEEVLAHVRELGNEVFGNWAAASLGVGRILAGRMSEGMKLIEESSRRCNQNEHEFFYRISEWFKAKVYVQMVVGEPPPARILFKNLGFLVAHLPFAAGRAEFLLGDAIRYFGKVGAYGWHAQALLDLGLLHRAKKRRERARECLTEAEALFVQAGADVFLRQARDALSTLPLS